MEQNRYGFSIVVSSIHDRPHFSDTLDKILSCMLVSSHFRLCCTQTLIRLQSAARALTSGPLVIRACHQDAGPGVHLGPPGLLQLTAVRHQRWATAQRAVDCSRFRMQLHAWSPVLDGVTTSHLCCVSCIGCKFARESFQDRGTGSPVASGHSTCVPHRPLPPTVRYRLLTTAF